MMVDTKFSVLLSIYRKEKAEYFDECLKSIYSQTVKSDEIIIIEDGPLPEELHQIIRKYKELYNNITTYSFESNVMLGKALAKGVELCSYDLIARMDTDDIALPDRFEKQLRFMTNHVDVSVLGGSIIEFDHNGKYEMFKEMPTDMNGIKKYARYRNPINHMTAMFRKQDVIEVGNYQHYPFLEDYYLWIRLLSKGKIIINLNEPLVRVRIDNNLYRRRGGKEYFYKYIQLRTFQYHVCLLKKKEYVYSIFYTALITLQPSFIRKKIYRRILRKKL